MKKTKEKGIDISEKAADCRCQAETYCEDRNYQLKTEAVEEFENGETAKYFRECGRHAIGMIASRLKDVKNGNASRPLLRYDVETIVRLLSTCTTVECDFMDFDPTLSDEDTVEEWELDNLVQDGYMTTVDTPTTTIQSQLFDVMGEYATAAASYANHIGSESLTGWAEMIDILNGLSGCRWSGTRLSEDDAVRLMDLERAASTRLRLDKIIAKLPPFKPAKVRKPKAK